ncbi:MAG: Hsp20/alpha crystallin family protein [Balneolaceae bacterium]|nr:MAG: Hsp20/alpha crystallin family protein [Balneolaceae bacterium]
MTLVRFRDHDIEAPVLPRTFSEMLDTFFNEAVTGRENFVPGIDVMEGDKQYEIRVTLPGIKKDEVKIELEDNTLTVSGERKFENEEKNKRYHLVESRFGTFKRSFTLPRNVDNSSIDAKMAEGILNITIKKDEKSVSRQIAIK